MSRGKKKNADGTPKRGRGRPRKTPLPTTVEDSEVAASAGELSDSGAAEGEPKAKAKTKTKAKAKGKGKAAKYSFKKNGPEICMVVYYCIYNFGPVTADTLAFIITGTMGMNFGRDDWAVSAIGKACKSLKTNGMIVGDRLAKDEHSGKTCEEFRINKTLSSFQKSEAADFLRPLVTSMSLLSNPETKEWVETLEGLMAGNKVAREQVRFHVLRIRLKATSIILGVKSLPQEEEKSILRAMGEKYDASHQVSFFRRVGAGLLKLPDRGLKMAILGAAPDIWGPNIDYQMITRLLPFDPTVFDSAYDQPCYQRSPTGTFVGDYPVVRNGNSFSKKDPSTIKRIETISPGFYVTGYVWVSAKMGVMSVLEPLRRGLYMGAGRGQGQGEMGLVDFEILGFSDTPGVIGQVNLAHDAEVDQCNNAILQLMSEVVPPDASSFRKENTKAGLVWSFGDASDMPSVHQSMSDTQGRADEFAPPSGNGVDSSVPPT